MTDILLATPVGSAGISLSGGQKQRLALARAVYARKEIIILDDVFSGLDAETEDHVFTRLFGTEGLLRQMGTTVLLVTHAVHRLSFSDHVVSLDSSGHISEQGQFGQLKTSGGYVQNLTTKLRTNSDSGVKEQPEVATLHAPAFKIEVNEHVAQAEELNRQTGDFSVYKYYFASIGWKRTLVFAMFVVLYGVASKMTEFLLTYCKCQLLLF
jgi:ATP-binding cassette subfamily C (CFTR/MRP) protein 1